MNEIKWQLQEKALHILFVSESNLKRSHDRSMVDIDGYSFHTAKMIRSPEKQVSRLVAYVREGIIVRRREDLESDEISAICMEAGLPKEKKFLICGLYREWARLKTDGYPINESGTIQEQEKRWDIFLDAWEDALDGADDVCVMGDANIDLLKVFEKRSHSCRKMSDKVNLRILSRGVVQVINEYIRYVASKEPSLLDHIYLTRPELATHKVTEWGTSDLRLIELNKIVKGSLPCVTRIRKRTFKKFSRKDFIADVKAIRWYTAVYSEDDVNEAAVGWHFK